MSVECECVPDVVLSVCHMLLLDELCPFGMHIVWKYLNDRTNLDMLLFYAVIICIGM